MRAREWCERASAGPRETRQKISNVAPEEITKKTLQLTRSKTSPFNLEWCFFCDGSESHGKTLLLLLPSPYAHLVEKKSSDN